MDSVQDGCIGSEGGVSLSEMGNMEEEQIWGPLTLPASTVMLMSVSLSSPQLICTLPEASRAGTHPSSLSLSLTQHHVGPKEASARVCGMDK